MTRKRIEALLARYEPKLRRRFRQVLSRVHDRWTVAQLEAALEGGTIGEVLDDLEKAAATFAAQTEAVTVIVAQEVSAQLAEKLDTLVSYDVTNARAVDALRRNRARLVQGLRAEQREVIADALAEQTAGGINPRQQAVAIRDTLGLTREQARWVRAYRRRLESLDRRALELKLRDARYDGTVARAIDQGQSLTSAQVDKLVTRYHERALKYRAEVVARTEALRAVHQGAEEGYQQAVDDGTLDADRLVCTWHAGSIPRTRHWHASMRGQKRRWGQAFTSGLGNALRYPCDPDAPAEDSVQCRCAKSTRVHADAGAAAAALAAAA